MSTCPGVTARRDFPNEAGQPTPRVYIKFDPSLAGITAEAVWQHLWSGDPAIAAARAGTTGIYLTPDTLEPGEEHVITERLLHILNAARSERLAAAGSSG